ncbi:hypothetical protein BDU57DRAFT_561571 [Ampelomyces quisqualis]|uniref:Uncharacterized protein n=1 Tax=Ampelomyces quisqualis TaxID=50730 RepID=A0A6A5R021_AMPQU|nr:hypothetical protein BDU57DRAFT_561571 [Ampelomyces quisqualis]
MADPGPKQHIAAEAPESESPHERHESNALSHYLLEVTAFTPEGSTQTALAMRDTLNSKTIEESYATISANLNAPNKRDASRTEYATRDPDRVGILIEHDGRYLTVLETMSEDSLPDDRRSSWCGWLARHQIDMHLLCEWECIPKKLVGLNFITAARVPEGADRGWWHVHSERITFLRDAVGEEAVLAERGRDIVLVALSEKEFLVACEDLFKNAAMMAELAWVRLKEEHEMEEEMGLEGWEIL